MNRSARLREIAAAVDEVQALVAAAIAEDDGAKPTAWTREACDDWIERFGGTAPGGQIGKSLKPLVAKAGWMAVRLAWRRYLGATEAQFVSAPRFAATYGEWAPVAAKPESKRKREECAATITGRAAWERAQEALRDSMARKTYALWVEPVRYLGDRGRTLYLAADDQMVRQWLPTNYHKAVMDALGSTDWDDFVVSEP